MKILFAAPEKAWGGFLQKIQKELPEHDFVASGRFSIDSLWGFQILIPTMTPVTQEIMKEADDLRLIQQCGVGLEGVDLEAARDLNIAVANVPSDISGNADSVAELGIYLMVGLARDVRGMARSLNRKKMGEPQGRALKGQTVGIIGLGGLGRALIHHLKSFDVRLIGIKQREPQKAKEDLGLDWVGGPEDLDSLLSRSDFVVLCLPLSGETKQMMNRKTLAMMKPGAYLINLSRGGLIDRLALEEALIGGVIAGAGLDVFWEEPPDPQDPIFQHNILATPHVGGSTDVSMRGIVQVVAENIRRVERNQEPLYLKSKA
jgi:phosphoglycerate dehydrogenase-like enzyme